MLPNDIKNSFEKDFHFPEKMAFCQMATQSNNYPHVRTVRLYGIEEDKGLIFVTHTASKKWNELKNNPNTAVCFLHPEYQIQLRAECRVTLLNYTLAPYLAEKCWKILREDVKKIYHDNFKPGTPYPEQQSLSVPKNIPDCFGLIVAAPHFWEYLFTDSDYPNSIRYVYTRSSEQNWVRKRSAIRAMLESCV